MCIALFRQEFSRPSIHFSIDSQSVADRDDPEQTAQICKLKTAGPLQSTNALITTFSLAWPNNWVTVRSELLDLYLVLALAL